MKKQLLLFALLLLSFAGFAQQPALPPGSLPLGTTYYKAPNGTIWMGATGKGFVQVTNKTSLDSLALINYDALKLKVNKSGDTITGNLTIANKVYQSIFVSPYLNGVQQGYSWNGTNHFLYTNDRILKLANDASWTVLSSTDNALAALGGFVNHIGDGDFSASRDSIFVPVEYYNGCGNGSTQKLAIFSKELELLKQYDLSPSPGTAERGCLTVWGNYLVIGDFCDGTKLFKYNKSGVLISTIPFETPIQGIQGIKFYNGSFYITNETQLFTCNTDGTNIKLIANFRVGDFFSHIAEGLDVVDGVVRVLLNKNDGIVNNVYYYAESNSIDPIFRVRSAAPVISYVPVEIGNGTSLNTTLSVNNLGWRKSVFSNNLSSFKSYIGADDSSGGFGTNAYYDANNGGWIRNDPSKASFLMLNSISGGQFQVRVSPAASGNISWNVPFTINPTGLVNITPNISATANNQTVFGFNISPTFTDGSFTNVTHIHARVNGDLQVTGNLLSPKSSTYALNQVGNGAVLKLKSSNQNNTWSFIPTSVANASGSGKLIISNTENTTVGANLTLDSIGRVGLYGISSPAAFLHLPSAISSSASLRVPVMSSVPNTPTFGDMWNTGANLKFVLSRGTQRTVFYDDSDSPNNSIPVYSSSNLNFTVTNTPTIGGSLTTPIVNGATINNTTLNSGIINLTQIGVGGIIKAVNSTATNQWDLIASQTSNGSGDGKLIWSSTNSTTSGSNLTLEKTGLIGTYGLFNPTARLDITGSNTGSASLRIRPFTAAPTSPNPGDIWNTGTTLKYVNTSSVRRITQTDDVSPVNGAIPIGNGTDFTTSTLTAGSGVTITNSSGSITIAATGSSSSTLQTVTDTGNTSTNSMQFTGAGNYDTGLNSLSFGYSAGVGSLSAKSPLGITSLILTGQNASFSTDSEISLTLAKPSLSGVAGTFNGRLKISNATQSDDATSLSQVNSLISASGTLQAVTNSGSTTTNIITTGGLNATGNTTSTTAVLNVENAGSGFLARFTKGGLPMLTILNNGGIGSSGVINQAGTPLDQNDLVRLRDLPLKNYTSATSTYTMPTAGTFRFTGTACTVTIPPVVGNEGKIIYLINRGSGILNIVTGSGGNDIDDFGSTSTSLSISNNQNITLINDGVHWTRL